jgi:hypothetical protein
VHLVSVETTIRRCRWFLPLPQRESLLRLTEVGSRHSLPDGSWVRSSMPIFEP